MKKIFPSIIVIVLAVAALVYFVATGTNDEQLVDLNEVAEIVEDVRMNDDRREEMGEDTADADLESEDDDAASTEPITLPVTIPEPDVVSELVIDPIVEEVSEVKTFNVSGGNFFFEPSAMRVNVGDTVRVVFTSESGFHDWALDEFSAATTQISSGNTTEVTFVANKAGSFEYYCSVGSHRAKGMVGTLIVE